MPYTKDFLFYQNRHFVLLNNDDGIRYPQLLREALINKDLPAIGQIIESADLANQQHNHRYSFQKLNKSSLWFVYSLLEASLIELNHQDVASILKYYLEKGFITQQNFSEVFLISAKGMNEKAIKFLLSYDKKNLWLTIENLYLAIVNIDETANTTMAGLRNSSHTSTICVAFALAPDIDTYPLTLKSHIEKEFEPRKILALTRRPDSKDPDSKNALPETVKSLTNVMVSGKLGYLFHNLPQLVQLKTLTLHDCEMAGVPNSPIPNKNAGLENLSLSDISLNLFRDFLEKAGQLLDCNKIINLHIRFKDTQEIDENDINKIIKNFPNLTCIKFENIKFKDINQLNRCVALLGEGLKSLNKIDLSTNVTIQPAPSNSDHKDNKDHQSVFASDPKVSAGAIVNLLERRNLNLVLSEAILAKEDIRIQMLLCFDRQSNMRNLGDDILNLIPDEYRKYIVISRKEVWLQHPKPLNAAEKLGSKFQYEIRTKGDDIKTAKIVLEQLGLLLNNILKKFNLPPMIQKIHPDLSIVEEPRTLVNAIIRWEATNLHWEAPNNGEKLKQTLRANIKKASENRVPEESLLAADSNLFTTTKAGSAGQSALKAPTTGTAGQASASTATHGTSAKYSYTI